MSASAVDAPPSYDEAIHDHFIVVDDLASDQVPVEVAAPPADNLPPVAPERPDFPPPAYRFRKVESAVNPLVRTLFIVQLILSLVFFIVYLRKAQNAAVTPVGDSATNGISQSGLTRILVLSSLAAGAIAIGLLALVRRNPEVALSVSVKATIAALLGIGIFALAELQIIAGIFCFLMALGTYLYWMWSKRSIAITASLLTISLRVIESCRPLILAAVAFAIVTFAYLCMWIVMFVSVLVTANAQLVSCDGTGGASDSCSLAQSYRGSLIALSVILMFCCLWSTSTLQGSLRTSIARVTAKFWWTEELQIAQRGGEGLLESVSRSMVIESVKDSVTSLLGAVAYGSALLSSIRTARMIATTLRDSAQDRGSWIWCAVASLIECFLRVLEELQAAFNEFAFTYIGVYAEDWSSAAHHTWQLIQSHHIIRSFLLLRTQNLTIVFGGPSLCVVFFPFAIHSHHDVTILTRFLELPVLHRVRPRLCSDRIRLLCRESKRFAISRHRVPLLHPWLLHRFSANLFARVHRCHHCSALDRG